MEAKVEEKEVWGARQGVGIRERANAASVEEGDKCN